MRTKLIQFREKVRALPTWKKVAIVAVILAIPAGMLLGAYLYKKWSTRKRS